jgi:hypothetical protein
LIHDQHAKVLNYFLRKSPSYDLLNEIVFEGGSYEGENPNLYHEITSNSPLFDDYPHIEAFEDEEEDPGFNVNFVNF